MIRFVPLLCAIPALLICCDPEPEDEHWFSTTPVNFEGVNTEFDDMNSTAPPMAV
ncbi:MAG: hypothetical protein GF331_26075, partial [Chitinivibrionales bacterium]|nr:hypothetical protein [Chitinivibrionales bacterium]